MTDRPTCGSCPHQVNGMCFFRPADWQQRDCGPTVEDTRPCCQHHPHMGRWLASREEPAAPPMPADQLAELERWREAFAWRQ